MNSNSINYFIKAKATKLYLFAILFTTNITKFQPSLLFFKLKSKVTEFHLSLWQYL
jgi:hypothetical protein